MSFPFTPLRAVANVAGTQTDSVLVAAVANKRIRVLAAIIGADTAITTAVLNSKPSGAGTAISQVFNLAANSVNVIPLSTVFGHWETAVGEGLSATTGAGGGVGFDLLYVVI
jgi:hypothetical protein